jgi:hypothetical protein
MSRDGLIALAITVTVIHLYSRWDTLPAFTWGDALGFTVLGLLVLFLVRPKRHNARPAHESAAFRLGKTLNRVQRRLNG